MISEEEDRRRIEWLQALAVEMDAQPRPLPQRPERPAVPFTIRSHDDDDDAQVLVSLHHAVSADTQPKKSFSVRQSLRLKSDPVEAPDPNMVYAVLEKHIADGGHPATTEALVVKLIEAGGDVNMSRVTKKTLRIPGLPKYQPLERSRLLCEAMEREDNALTSILVPYADQTTLNDCLAKAVTIGRIDYIRQLLSYGAALERSGAGEDVLRQLCIKGQHSETVGLLVACHPEMTANFAGLCLTDAVDAGCLETVVALVNSTTYFGNGYSIALEKAIRSSRADILVAMICGMGLGHTGYDTACGVIFTVSATPSGDFRLMLEVLLCAGANGPCVAQGLLSAVENENDELLDLLLRYGASVCHNSAAAVCHVLKTKRFETAQKLLAPGVVLDASIASHCLSSIPDDVPSNVRSTLVGLLMEKGASGDELAKCLVRAVRAGDIASMELMLGYGSAATECKFACSPIKASVDYNNGKALVAAIKTRKPELIQTVLLGGPSEQTLVAAIPTLVTVIGTAKKLDETALRTIRLVLKYCHTFCETSTVLSAAVDRIPADERDPKLLSLAAEKRPPFRYLQDLLALAVKNENVVLVERLLNARQKSHTQVTLSAAFAETVHVNDHATRMQLMRLLIAAGAHKDASAVSDVLLRILASPKAIDLAMIHLLVDKGQVNVNLTDGAAIVMAVERHSPVILRLLIDKRMATDENVARGLSAIVPIEPTKDKAAKLSYLLEYPDVCSKDLATNLLWNEIMAIGEIPERKRHMTCVRMLVAAGADVTVVLCRATELSLGDAVKLLLAEKPASKAIGQALLVVFKIQTASDRHKMARLLLQAKPSESDVAQARRMATASRTKDPALIQILAGTVGPSEGNKTGPPAVASVRDCGPSEKLGDQSRPVPISDNTAQRGAGGGSSAGASTPTPATDSGKVLSVDWALVCYAAKGYSGSVQQRFEMFPSISPATATEVFRAAAKLHDVDTKLEIFKMLVGHDVNKDIVSKELATCVGLGRQGCSLAKILLALGVNVNYNDGEALVSATIAGNLNVVGTLLGMDLKSQTDMAKIPSPSQGVLVRMLCGAWQLPGDERFTVITWLFGAGLAPGDVVDERLWQAVAEPAPDKRLIRFLFKRGASAAPEGYKVVVLAASRTDPGILSLCLEYVSLSESNAGTVLGTFIASNTGKHARHHLTEAMEALLSLLFKLGAKNDGVGLFLRECIAHSSNKSPGLVKRLVSLLLKQGSSADHPGVLEAAVNAGDLSLLQMVLYAKPNGNVLNTAFPSIFSTTPKLDEACAIAMIRAFSNDHGNILNTAIRVFAGLRTDPHPQRPLLDPRHAHPVPVLYSALLAYPASPEVAQAVVDAGFGAGDVLPDNVAIDVAGTTENGISVLAWAVAGALHVPSAVITVLVQDAKFTGLDTPTPRTGYTPLMLAVHTSRPRVVRYLLAAGADPTVVNGVGWPPIEVAIRLRKPCRELLVNAILSTGRHKDDGLLHDAACRLDPALVQAFAKHGYDMNYKSPKHGGRTVLGELCLSGLGKYDTEAEVDDSRRLRLAQVVAVLLGSGASTKILYEKKSPLLLALENKHAVIMMSVLLEAGLSSEVNEPWNCYDSKGGIGSSSSDSLTKYTARHLNKSNETRRRLLKVLRNAGGKEFP